VSARKLAIAADHAGAALKAALLNELQTIAPDWEGIDLGGDGSDLTDDYPDASRAVAELMQRGGAERGLLICGSGDRRHDRREQVQRDSCIHCA